MTSLNSKTFHFIVDELSDRYSDLIGIKLAFFEENSVNLSDILLENNFKNILGMKYFRNPQKSINLY